MRRDLRTQRRPLPRPLASWLLLWALWLPAPARAQSPEELLKRAQDAFEYGDFKRTTQLLQGVPDGGALGEGDRIEAWRLLGLSNYYLENKTEAENALFGLLKQNPDYQLDPFYVPPAAVSFFDEVRKRNEQYLAPIRERRRARLKALEEEEQLRVEADRRRKEELARPPLPMLVERTTTQSSRLVASLPGGLGQFQNGNVPLGATLGALQLGAAIASIASYGLVEGLRGDNGRFAPAVVERARSADGVKWWAAGAFYLLWLAGAVEAHVNYVPTRVVGETSVPAPPPPGPASASAPAPER
jgi:hypothetical protein